MRLIDADKLIQKIYKNSIFRISTNAEGKNVLEIIDEQLTDYDIDKVFSELVKSAKEIYGNVGMGGEMVVNLDDVIKIVKHGCVSDDVCEWHKVKNGNAYKSNTHEEIYDSRVLDWCKCPYCEKKIKVVE